MALIDLKSDLSKFRADFKTPSLENKVNASRYNIDDVPKTYGNDVNQTNFKGITGTNFIYPSLLINGKRLWEPAGTKNSQPVITFPGPQNFLNDSTAAGFTLDMYKTGQSKKETQFKSYFNYANFKSNYRIADVVSTGPTGWQMGETKLISQLGNGSTNLIKSYDSLITKTYNWYTPTGDKGKTGKPEPHTGFYSNKKYTSFGTPYDGFLAATYNTNSPIDDVYKKYNLRDEAHNTTYMPQPFILRGIQRKGKETPQYWGFGSRSGFDDGLIRGGVVTVADRIVADTVRIAKFMASPKGLLWIVKQIGLGLTNPKVEAIGGPLTRQTRIHTGVASLLSVPGTALGLHFTRHGIPFANEIASYENVIRGKQLLTLGGSYSRLIALKKEFATGKVASNLEVVGDRVKILNTKGLGSAILSGLAGPQSVYGIGPTQIRRVVDTTTDAKERAANLNSYHHFKVNDQYAPLVSNSKYKTSETVSTRPGDAAKRTANDVDMLGNPYVTTIKSLKTKLSETNDNATPGAKLNSTNVDLSTAATRVKAYNTPDSTFTPTGINNYLTLAYNKIPKDKKSFRDFRNDIEAKTTEEKSILGTGTNKDYYTKNNLETKYGFGTPGIVGADRTNPNDYIIQGEGYKGTNRTILIDEDKFRGDKVNAYDIGDVDKTDVYKPGAEDFIKFYFEDGDIGRNVMIFRCTMNGFSDSFSPGWNRIDIMGRPDGAYLYTSFERSVSFNFSVNALSRAEMVPMWRKLNYLASYTMPDFTSSGTKPGGPFMRITIGSLFQQTPGFIESLTYTIPDETTWDIAEDSGTNPNAKQLPLSMDVSMTFKVIGDYRPQLKGRVYSLSPFGGSTQPGNWLTDAEPTQVSKEKKAKKAKTEADKPKTI